MKVCAEIRRLSVVSPRNCFSGSTELYFGNPWNCLSGAHRFVLWESSKRSLGDHRLSSLRNRLRESAKSSSGSLISFVTHAVNMHNWLSLSKVTVTKCIQQSQTKGPRNKVTILTCTRVLGNGHPQSVHRGLRKSCINRCAISLERSMATLQRIIPQVRTEVPRIPSNVSAYSLRWFRRRFTEVRKLSRRILRKTYAANQWNSVTNLWHVPYLHSINEITRIPRNNKLTWLSLGHLRSSWSVRGTGYNNSRWTALCSWNVPF